jgi:hypothetical protein
MYGIIAPMSCHVNISAYAVRNALLGFAVQVSVVPMLLSALC